VTRAGLTLIETLAATVILSASAAVCASMLRSARMSLDSPMQSIQDLAALADAFMEEPESFGIERSTIPKMQFFSLHRPESIELGLAFAMVSNSKTADQTEGMQPHSWLVFEHKGLSVVRYLALPENNR
jgi:Tfp pilus assembly protein PilV